MKRQIAILLALVLMLSLTACGGKSPAADTPTPTATVEPTPEPTPEPKPTKEELLASAVTLTKDDFSKAIDNLAFAKTLVGNTYVFGGVITSVKDDYAVIGFTFRSNSRTLQYSPPLSIGYVYLPIEDLININTSEQPELSLVGTLSEVSSFEQSYDGFPYTVSEFIFKDAAIVTDRFEITVILDSPNYSFGSNCWNFQHLDRDPYLNLIHFAEGEDVSSYRGKEVTISTKSNRSGYVDAYIVQDQ